MKLRGALLLYVLFTCVAFAVAAPELLRQHTRANHFALLAECWLSGRLDLGGPPPAYTGNDDFALFQGRHYVVFPPFPALLLMPFVGLAGGATRLPDAVFFLGIAGLAPALLFLGLERLGPTGDSGRTRAGGNERSSLENWLLASAFGFGSVYFFCAVQGSVWFAAHVVAAVLTAGYLLCAVRAEYPLMAGILLGLAGATRTPLFLAAPFFISECLRRRAALAHAAKAAHLDASDRAARELRRKLARFAAPVLVSLTLLALHNWLRFGDPLEFGYRYLTIVWQARIERYGLFSAHYLARNLGVILTSLPWVHQSQAPWVINLHGLALWLTTPIYALLPWPRRRSPFHAGLAWTALLVALPSLFYQNTGWLQFGYRFSNDYAPFLFGLFAVGGHKLKAPVATLLLLGVLVNAFGALTFGRPEYARYYFAERTQQVLYEPD